MLKKVKILSCFVFVLSVCIACYESGVEDIAIVETSKDALYYDFEYKDLNDVKSQYQADINGIHILFTIFVNNI